MSREPVTDKTATPKADRALDQRLRQALAPDATTVERLVTQALAHPPARAARAGSPRRSWQLAGGLVAALLVAVILPVLGPKSNPPENAAPAVEEIQEPQAAPALLRISNEAGPVTVTTAASKVVFFTPER